MSFRNLVLVAAAAIVTSPAYCSTFYAGFEDYSQFDYDYNDVVFHVSGDNLKLNSSATWYAQPTLGTSNSPFWNRSSKDGDKYNVGYCIYGGGSCHAGSALAPGSKYLASSATSSTGSANDVTFTANGSVTLSVDTKVTAGNDVLGWYLLSNPTNITWMTSNANTFTFTPSGTFGLAGKNITGNNGNNLPYYSQTKYGESDTVSHFAFFAPAATATPEPASIALMGSGLLAAIGATLRRRRP